MKKWKKVISAAVASAMVMTMMTGCGSDNSSAGGTSQSATSSAEDTSTASSQGSSENSGVAGSSFKIGGVGPTTGSNAIYGMAVKNAIQLAVDEINAAGGVDGYTFEFNFQDDETDAEKAVNAYNTLKDWGAQMIVGAVTSGSSAAVAEKTYADNMFQLTPSATSVDCVKYPNSFRVCFSDPNQGSVSAAYIGQNQLAQKVAVIYDSSDIYSSGIYESFVTEAKNQNFEVVAAEAFTADSKTDFSVQLQKAKDAGADMVFLPIYYSESALILTQASKMGYAPTFFSCDGMDGILGVESFDTSLAEGVMLLTPFAANATDDLTVNFVNNYKEKFGDTPNQFAADAYDAVYAIKAAIEESKATPDMTVSDLCDALKGAMVKIKISGLTSKEMSWTEDGEPNKEPLAVKIENGEYVIM